MVLKHRGSEAADKAAQEQMNAEVATNLRDLLRKEKAADVEAKAAAKDPEALARLANRSFIKAFFRSKKRHNFF